MFNQPIYFNSNQPQQQQQQFNRQFNYSQESQQSDIQSQFLQKNNQNTYLNANKNVNLTQNCGTVYTNDINTGQQFINPNLNNNYNNTNNYSNNASNNQCNYVYNNNNNFNNNSNNASNNQYNNVYNNNYGDQNNNGNYQQLYQQFKNNDKFQQINSHQQIQPQQPEWKDEYENIYYIQGLCIPIPTFVDSKQRDSLKLVLSEINQKIMCFLQNKQDKEQIINQIQEKFKISNQIEFNSNNNIFSNQSLSLNDEETDMFSTDYTGYTNIEENQKSILRSYVTQAEQTQNNYNNQINSEDKLTEFIINMFEFNEIQKILFLEEFENELKSNKKKIKNNYLIDMSDFEQSTIHKIKEIKEIRQFGFDLCSQEKYQIIYRNKKFQAVSFNFKKDKLLKTAMYCILKNFICSRTQVQSKKYLITQLMHIDSKNKQLEVDNIILRQIFLRFFDLVVIQQGNSKKIAIEFLDNLFKYEFISSLLLDHYKRLVRFFCQKKLKENPQGILDQFVESYYLELFVIDSDAVKYSNKSSKTNTPYFLCLYTQSNIQQNELDQISIVQDIKKSQISR